MATKTKKRPSAKKALKGRKLFGSKTRPRKAPKAAKPETNGDVSGTGKEGW